MDVTPQSFCIHRVKLIIISSNGNNVDVHVVHIYLYTVDGSMYMLYYGGEWSTGYTQVVSFDRARGRSPSGLSKLTTSVNGVDHKHSAIV